MHLFALVLIWTIFVFSVYYYPGKMAQKNIRNAYGEISKRNAKLDKQNEKSNRKKISSTVGVTMQQTADRHSILLQYIRPSAANKNIMMTEFWSHYNNLQNFIVDLEKQSLDVVELEINETDATSKKGSATDHKKEPQQLYVRLGLVFHPSRSAFQEANKPELQPVKRDPFFFVMNENPVVDLPSLDIKGIKVTEEGSDEKGAVMFGNQICFEGEICNGYLIKRVERNQLFLVPENLQGTGRGVRYWYIDARKQSQNPSSRPTGPDS
ncbi:hypothetical protein SIID45300_03263 [Candidatus Magnetaquicoccaceae bacterium FCR-1]|uniref:Uncharacterized protein n=1 Tax=Candidatus Magnetaquiglobus chichijimensis TaxID=3141448 RepID=A0ABQ0CDF0_9PROT